MELSVATCQFPTSSEIEKNYTHIAGLMKTAAERGAEVAHFPESCLPGYAGTDIESFEGLNWKLLRDLTARLIDMAGELGLWVVLGSAHRLSGTHKPHNSLYIINDNGQIVDRYDKRFCAGNATENSGDLAHYTAGNHFSVFDIKGVRCGAQICHDYRYPELYREYKRRGVQLMFHSFHAAHIHPDRLKMMEAQVGADYHAINIGKTYPEITMPAAMITEAANSHMWISCPNSSAVESCWGSFFVRADGVITGRLKRHSTDILISRFDTEVYIYDSTRGWRDRAIKGILHSGKLVDDERSDNRTKL